MGLYKYILTLLFSLLGGIVFSQQLFQTTQYVVNDYVYNPAVAGVEDYTNITSSVRTQWTGFDGAPKTYMLCIEGGVEPQKRKRSYNALGGYVLSESLGSLKKSSLYGSFAHNFALKSLNNGQYLRMSMSLSGGMSQIKVDRNSITIEDPVDPALDFDVESVVLPDAIFAFYTYTDNYYFGTSVHQLLRRKIKLFNTGIEDGRLRYHYYISGGYKYKFFHNKLEFEPSILYKQTSNLPMHFDYSGKLTYDNMSWLGISYRTKDAVSFSVGYIYKDFVFGYSYDYTVSNIKYYNNGTHEIVIGYRIESGPKMSMYQPSSLE